MNEVLILTSENDQTTNDVIDWLLYYEVPFTRINGSTKLKIESVEISNRHKPIFLISFINFTGKKVYKDLFAFNAYWYRRGNFSFEIDSFTKEDIEEYNEFPLYLFDDYLNNNKQSLVSFLHLWLKSTKSINSFFDNRMNKLFNLTLAQRLGFKIPESLVASTPNQVCQFYSVNQDEIITKAIAQGYISSDNFKMELYTNKVEKDDLEKKSTFSPTLFQSNLSKLFELRVFYLNGECFASAIFSQKNDNTKVDFRRYNFKNPNRVLPFRLPEEIANKIYKFMTAIGMNCGSLDLVVTKTLEYIFLEVNPVGQFKQISFPCNYYLEKKIAEYFSYETSKIK